MKAHNHALQSHSETLTLTGIFGGLFSTIMAESWKHNILMSTRGRCHHIENYAANKLGKFTSDHQKKG